MKGLSILGSTGSIGSNVLHVVDAFPGRFEVVGLAAGANVELLAEQVARHRPKLVSVADTAALDGLRRLVDLAGVRVASGPEGMVEVLFGSLPDPQQVKRLTSTPGGFQMNFQELETVRRLGLPITFFVMNNDGYASIRASQMNYFGALTGADAAKLCKPYRGILLHYTGMKTGAMLPLAVARVRNVGEPVVAIAATDRARAEDAAELVAVDYEPLPAVLSPAQALAPDAPLIHPELGDNVIFDTRLVGGDVDAAFDGAFRVYRRTFSSGRHTGVTIEPRSLVADFEPFTRSLTVWISTQVPHMMQAVLADLFGLPEQRVRGSA